MLRRGPLSRPEQSATSISRITISSSAAILTKSSISSTKKANRRPIPPATWPRPRGTEPDTAPPGGEALYVLVHTPYLRPHHDWKKMLPEYRRVILDKLKPTGRMPDLESRIVFERALTPQDIHDRYHVLNGAIYGLASHGKFLGAFKPGNRSPDLRGLYLAGGAAHPGPGMPMVLMSGWIAADALDRDAGASPSRARIGDRRMKAAAETQSRAGLPRVSAGRDAQSSRLTARDTCGRSFHSVRISASGLPPHCPDRPLVIYLNHAAWWDPLVCLRLAREFFRDRASFAPIDAAMLERYGFFRHLGFFGVEARQPRGALTFLRTTHATPRIFAQCGLAHAAGPLHGCSRASASAGKWPRRARRAGAAGRVCSARH